MLIQACCVACVLDSDVQAVSVSIGDAFCFLLFCPGSLDDVEIPRKEVGCNLYSFDYRHTHDIP